jgi:riboflavin kinase/FMN adenylyltransferase
MVRLNGVKNIVFDFGGVLVDLKPEACLEAFARLGMPQVADYLTPYGHKGPFGKLENGEITVSEFCMELRDLFRVEVTDEQIEQAWVAFLLHTPVNKMRMVHELARRYRVFLLSNTNPVHLRKLKEFDDAGYPVKECFEKLYLSYEVGLSKPGREIFNYVIRDAGIRPEETLFVDDGPANCQTAGDMGFRTFQPKPFEDFTGELLQPAACVATMGFFDGVHLGHRYLIDTAKRVALEKGLPSMVVSFWPHPRMVLNTNFTPQLLCDREEKEALLQKTGVDHVRTLRFDADLASMPAFRFMKEVLKGELHVSTLIIGFDHRFGNNRSEGYEEYKKYGLELGMEVLMADQFLLPEALRTEGCSTVSSSFIRRTLLGGKLSEANQVLGYAYTIRARVVGGNRIGRQIGFPTANLEPLDEAKLIPAIGIYAVWVWLGDVRHMGMLYIGKRPTLQQDTHPVIEVNILDFEGDLYGKMLSVEFLERFRGDTTFADLDALVVQLGKDRDYVRGLLSGRS